MVPGILPRGRLEHRWSDVIIKDIKDLNIRKHFAYKVVEWQRAIIPRKIELQRVRPIIVRQAL